MQNNDNIRPDPTQFLNILTNDVQCLSGDIRKIILEYARWPRDEKGEAEAKILDYQLQELQKTKYLAAAGLISSACMIIIGATALTTGDLLDPQVIKSWATPLLSTILGTSVITGCIDRWRVFKRGNFANKKKLKRFFCQSLLRICSLSYIPGFLLMSMHTNNAQAMGKSDLWVGGYSLLPSTCFLIDAIQSENSLPLQLQQLMQHLRNELYQPKDDHTSTENSDADDDA